LPHLKNAVVLLSGGLDSTTTLSIAKRDGFAVNALSFSYGQRHAAEVDAAKKIALAAGVARHEEPRPVPGKHQAQAAGVGHALG